MEEQRVDTEEEQEQIPPAEEEAPPAEERAPEAEAPPAEEAAPPEEGPEEEEAPPQQTEADTAEKEEQEEEQPAAEQRAKKSKAEPRPPSMVLRVALALAGLVLLSGFFLPWITETSGFELVINDDNLPSSQRIILALCPLVAVALTLAGVLGFRGSVWVGIIAGAAVLAYALFTIAYLLYQMIDVGLWMVLASALIAFAGGVFAKLWAAKKAREQAAAG